MNNEKTPVSIVTVSFNSEKTIARTIESVLNQTYTNIEYIIMDGNSKDKTVEVAHSYDEAFAAKGIPFTVVSEPDKGMYDALNKAIALAKGEIVGGINSDDYYEPDAVEKMVALYEKEHYDAAWGDLRVFTATGEMRKTAKVGKLWTTTHWCHPSMFATKAVLTEFPYACENMYDDFDFITRVYIAGKKICTINEIIANFTFGGMSTKKSFKEAMERVNITYGIYRKHGMSRLYWFHRVALEMAKLILG
ncbi:MAG: glycosyltransferase [Clostridia bacterium]|nr:glycosyltransferase [Clostridia bacterium]